VPRGRTALLDSAGVFITEVGERLAALPSDQRPGQVICLIMTDGMENASRRWTWDAVKKLITEQREVYGWKFIFLGADIDAVEVGERMGVDPRYAMTFDKGSDLTVRAAYARTSGVMSDLKRGYLAREGFTAADRAEAMGEAPKRKRKRGA
ncbi:MAG: VWA domain-containing protein, partial [Mycobacterium sp.]|nr:VWA domain-containing protein [Mycobacterium sp.]